MASLLLPSALIAYLIGVFLAVLGNIYRSDRSHRASAAVLITAWALHLAALVERGMTVGGLPINNAAEFLLVLGWAVLTLHLILWVRWRIYAAALVLPPIAAAMGFVALQLLPVGPVSESHPHYGWTMFHIAVSTVGLAILFVAFAMSVIYILQDWALKNKRTLTALDRLPSLDRCDRIGLNALGLGFLLLTIGIVTGMAVNASFDQGWWSAGAKQTFPLLAWIVFAVILLTRTALGFRGRKSAYLTITGVTLGLLTVIGMSL
jgi:ABC-type uncharacterized transport system permease subunit